MSLAGVNSVKQVRNIRTINPIVLVTGSCEFAKQTYTLDKLILNTIKYSLSDTHWQNIYFAAGRVQIFAFFSYGLYIILVCRLRY